MNPINRIIIANRVIEKYGRYGFSITHINCLKNKPYFNINKIPKFTKGNSELDRKVLLRKVFTISRQYTFDDFVNDLKEDKL